MTKKFSRRMLSYVRGTLYMHPFDPDFDIAEEIAE